MGFPLQGFFLPQSLRTLPDGVPSWPFLQTRGSLDSVLPTPAWASKALLPARIRHFQAQNELSLESRCPLGFSPSRDFPLDTACHSRGRSPLELRRRPRMQNDVQHSMTETAPQGLSFIEVGSSLSRLPPLLDFCTFSQGRRFDEMLRLAYGFTTTIRCCHQPLHGCLDTYPSSTAARWS